MAASQSCTVHFKTHRVCPIHTRNIGPIGPLSSTIPSPWIGTYPKAGLICHAWFKELLYQENGCVPITFGTFQDRQGLTYPHKKYWTHRSIIKYFTIALTRVLTQRQIWYAMHDSKSYCARKMAASQSRTVHSKTHRVCPIHTRNIGPIRPISSTIPSPWIESLPKGRFHMPCMIHRATVPGKWLRPNHVRYIPRPTGSVLSTLDILDPSVHYPVLYHHLESSPYPKADLICHAWFKGLLYQESCCVPITYGTFQDRQGLSYPHNKYWTHRSNIQYYIIALNHPYPKAGLICHAWFKALLYQENGCVPITYGEFQDPQVLSYPHRKNWTHRYIIQYYTITLNRVLIQRQIWYAMHDSKSYCTSLIAASQSRTVHSKTNRVCPIHTGNIGPIGPITVPYHHLESSPYAKAGLIFHTWFKEVLYQANGCVPIRYGTL